MNHPTTVLGAALFALVGSAGAEPVSFARDIVPIFKRSCVACHNETKAKAELNLESVDEILKGSGDGEVLVPGDADASLIYTVAAHQEDPVMPPENNKANAPRLKPDELALLHRWIEEGAKDDGSGAAAGPVEFAAMPGAVDAIYSVAISPDNLYAAAGRGNRVHLYHLPTGTRVADLSDPALADKGGAAHLDIVGALAFGGDGVLASGGFRTVKLWRKAENPVVASLPSLAAEPTASAVSGDGTWAAVADATGAVTVRSLSSAEEAPKANKDHAAAVSGVVFTDGGDLVTTSLDKAVKLRALSSDGGVRTLAELPSPVHAVTLVGDRVACGCEDGVVRLVPIEGATEVVELKGHSGRVVALVNCGASLISAGADAKLLGWNLDKPDAPAFQANNHSPVISAAATSDGSRFATIAEDKIVRLWNGADLKPITDLKTDAEAIRGQAGAEAALTVATKLRDSRKGALDAATKKVTEEKGKAKAAAEAVSKASGELDAKLATLASAAAAKRRAGDDTKAAEAVTKAQAEVDTADRARTESRRNAELAVRFSVRAAEAAAKADAALAAAEAEVVALSAALEVAKKAVGEASVALRQVAFSAEGKLLLAAAEDGKVYRWAAQTGGAAGAIAAGAQLLVMEPLADGRVLGVGANKSMAIYACLPKWELERAIGSHDDGETLVDRINAVAFSGDGRTLATGGGVPSRGGELKLWRVRDGQKLAENTEDHSDAISAVAFSPDGTRVATAATDRFVKVFQAEDATFERSFEGHTNHVLDVDWSADGLALASSGADNVVKLWDFEAGTQKKTVKGHSKPVTSVAFVGGGGTLVSSSGDKSVRLGEQPLPEAGTFVHAAEASDDGKMIAAGGEDSVLRIWNADDKKVILKLR